MERLTKWDKIILFNKERYNSNDKIANNGKFSQKKNKSPSSHSSETKYDIKFEFMSLYIPLDIYSLKDYYPDYTEFIKLFKRFHNINFFKTKNINFSIYYIFYNILIIYNIILI